MQLDFMILAGQAQAQGNLINILNGGWDTITVNAPFDRAQVPQLPDDQECVAILQGTVVIRLLFHHTETDRQHTFRLTMIDEDGGELGRFDGQFDVPRNPDLPVGWDQSFPILLPMPGIVLPRYGSYTMSLLVDEAHLTDKPFRVVKGYED